MFANKVVLLISVSFIVNPPCKENYIIIDSPDAALRHFIF